MQPAVANIYAAFEALTIGARERAAPSPDSPLVADELNGSPLAGKLVLYATLDSAGAATSLASSIAGAASLGLDPDAGRLTQSIRSGACDFVVNNLDEALRILKNELRKGQPVSVGLVTEVADCLEAMLMRGVQPDLLVFPAQEHERACADFVGRGARLLGFPDSAASANNLGARPTEAVHLLTQNPSRPGSSMRDEVWWSVAEAPAKWLPRLDALAAEALFVKTPYNFAVGAGAPDERLRWLRTAPRYLLHASEHYLKFEPDECEQFLEALRTHARSGAIPTGATVRRKAAGGQESVLHP